MFRNVRWFQFDGVWPESETELSNALKASEFKPCGPLTERSSGFEAVALDAGDSLARRVNGADLLRLRSQSRVLPHAAVNEELEARVSAFQQKMGEAPNGREKRRLKLEARDELLPKSLLKSDRIWGYVDPREKLIGIDTSSEANAERFLRRLTAGVSGLSIRPLAFNQPVEQLLGKFLFGDSPRQFELGDECRLQDLANSRGIVRCTNVDLTDQSIRNHVTDGMRLTHLGLQYDNVMRFVLAMDGVISKLKFVGEDEEPDDHDPIARLDAEFVLLTGTLRNLLGDLKKLLNGLA